MDEDRQNIKDIKFDIRSHFEEIRFALGKIPPHNGLVWFLSRESLREVTRNQKAQILTIDFHFPDLRINHVPDRFCEVAHEIDYQLNAQFCVVLDRDSCTLDIVYKKKKIADIKLLVLTPRKRLQYYDIGSWITMSPWWIVPLEKVYWEGVEWFVPNTKGEFIKSIYRSS